MVADTGREGFSLLRVDGGASRNSLLMQLQANAIQVPPSLPAPSPISKGVAGINIYPDCRLSIGC